MQLIFKAGNERNSPSGAIINSSQVRVDQSGVYLHPFDSLTISSSSSDRNGGRNEERLHLFINSSLARLTRWPEGLQQLRATRITANKVRQADTSTCCLAAACRHAATGSFSFIQISQPPNQWVSRVLSFAAGGQQ